MTRNRKVKTPRERRRQKLVFWSLCGGLIAYAVLGGDYKLYHLLFLHSEKDRVSRHIEDLRAENAALARQEARLERDTLLLEQLAREKGLKRKDEIIYRLVPLAGAGGLPSEPGAAQRRDSGATVGESQEGGSGAHDAR